MLYKKLNNFNLLFLLFFSSIFTKYIKVNHIFYYVYAICLVIVSINFTKKVIKGDKTLYNKKYLAIFLAFVFYTLIIGMVKPVVGENKLINLFISYFIIIMLLLKQNTKEYCITFYKNLTYIFNIFSLINIYEIIFKRGMFNSYFLDGNDDYAYTFNSDIFRTTSIYVHPIVHGLFLVILFWCNTYFIKNKKIKLVLQTVIVCNLYWTKSRSDWIALVVTVVLYYIKKNFRKVHTYKLKLTYNGGIKFICVLLLLTITIPLFYDNISKSVSAISKRLTTVTDDRYGDISRLQRLGTIDAMFEELKYNNFLDIMFGHGLGSSYEFMSVNQIAIKGFLTTDNQYLSTFYEFGIVGVVLYGLIIISFLFRFIRNKADSFENLYILIFFAISIALFFFEGFGWLDVLSLLVFNIGCVCIKEENLKENNILVENNNLIKSSQIQVENGM